MPLTNTFTELNLTAHTPDLNITPRRRIWGTSAATTIAASGVTPITVTVPLQDVLQRNDGLIIDYLFGSYTSNGNAFPIVTGISQLQLALAGTGIGVIIHLGSPEFTTQQVFGGLSLVFLPVPYFSALDIEGFVKQQNAANTIFTPAVQPLSLYMAIGITNTAATTQGTGTLNLGAVYRVVHGTQDG